MLYIEFDINDTLKFGAFQKVYELLYEIKPKMQKRSLTHWLELIPPDARTYIVRYYGEEPGIPLEEQHGLADMIDYLQVNMEVEYDYLRISGTTGMLGYSALAYPYGGSDRLMIFLKAFGCIPTGAYTGFDVVSIQWTEEYDYVCKAFPEQTKAYRAGFKSQP